LDHVAPAEEYAENDDVKSNNNSGGSELQGFGNVLSPTELYWRELMRSSTDQQRIGKNILLGSNNKGAIHFTNIELRTDMSDHFYFHKDNFRIFG
jgi:hypothetical protein